MYTVATKDREKLTFWGHHRLIVPTDSNKFSPFSAWHTFGVGIESSHLFRCGTMHFGEYLSKFAKKNQIDINMDRFAMLHTFGKLINTHRTKSSSRTWRRNSWLSIEIPLINLVTIPLLNDATNGMPTPFWLCNLMYFISFSLETPIYKCHS